MLGVLGVLGVFGVLVQLGDLPVQVGVPGPQLEAIQGLDVEVRTFDLRAGEKEISK